MVVPKDKLGGAERHLKHKVGNERLNKLNSKGDCEWARKLRVIIMSVTMLSQCQRT